MMEPGATVTALLPFEGHVDLFVTDTYGTVQSTFFEREGGWRNWFPIPSDNKMMEPGATVTALLPFEGHIDLFATDRYGAVFSTFYEPGGGWRNWFPIDAVVKMGLGATVTALLPFEGHVDLFATALNGTAGSGAGTVWSTFFEPQGEWRKWFRIHPDTSRIEPGATVTALLPFEGHLDLFVTDRYGTVWSTFFEREGGWRDWFPIPLDNKMMEPGATVTALLPFDGHVDLFTTDKTGAVWSTFFELQGGWRDWFLIP
jgi:hypothetical protein